LDICVFGEVFRRLRQRNKIFWIAILTDFAKQNQSKWRSKKNIIRRLVPPNDSQGLLAANAAFTAKLCFAFGGGAILFTQPHIFEVGSK
jgi:hypothetical protein